MNQETTFVLSYSTGQYDECSVTALAVMNDRHEANALCDKFNEIVKFYKNEFSAFAFMQEQTRILWNLAHGEIPSTYYERLKKDSNPIWKNIPNKEWLVIVEKHKESFALNKSKALAMRDERNQVVEAASKSFWDNVRSKMPDNLKDFVGFYPCKETESPYFSLEEVPIW
jgi:ABC-type bacteriocin/lantibiotic exporter with double-glycine peptidase domain